MKLGPLLQFYFCQGIAKFHIEIFIGKMDLTHTMKEIFSEAPSSCYIAILSYPIMLSYRYLQLADNTEITGDKYYKVRVLFEKLNFGLKQYGSFINHRVDESIIP